MMARWRDSRALCRQQPSRSRERGFVGRLRAGGWKSSASLVTRASVGKDRPLCLYTGTGSRAGTCSRSLGRSPHPALCSHRTCLATGVVSGRTSRSALPISPPRSPAGWTRPASSVQLSSRTRWAVRSSPNSLYGCRGVWVRWCSSVRPSILSGAQRATSCSAGCEMQHGNRGPCSRSPHATTALSASVRSWRPLGRRSPTGSSTAYRGSPSRLLSYAARTTGSWGRAGPRRPRPCYRAVGSSSFPVNRTLSTTAGPI